MITEMHTLSTATFNINPLTFADSGLESEPPVVVRLEPGLGLVLRLLVVLLVAYDFKRFGNEIRTMIVYPNMPACLAG